MEVGDGWVGELVSTDHTVIPDLSGSGAPAATINLDEPSPGQPMADPSLDELSLDEPLADPSPDELSLDEPLADTSLNEPRVETSPDTAFLDEPLVDASRKSPAVQTEQKSGVGKVLVGAVAAVVLGIAALVGWPVISSLLGGEDEPVTELAMSSEPTQRFVISDGMIYLEGSVPDEAVSLRIQDAAQRALGADRVINNFEISEDAFFDPNLPVSLSVAETVLFPTGISQVADEYAPLIDLAVLLMSSQPNTMLTVIGHTDNRGSEDVNAQLSLDRATAVAGEINSQGIDESRLTVEGRGESEPMATNDTPEGRSANRRVEFLISGLLN